MCFILASPRRLMQYSPPATIRIRVAIPICISPITYIYYSRNLASDVHLLRACNVIVGSCKYYSHIDAHVSSKPSSLRARTYVHGTYTYHIRQSYSRRYPNVPVVSMLACTCSRSKLCFVFNYTRHRYCFRRSPRTCCCMPHYRWGIR